MRDKNVVVIGASRGLGRSIVAAVSDAVARVLAVARSAEPLKQLAAEYPGVRILALDATEEGAPNLSSRRRRELLVPLQKNMGTPTSSIEEILYLHESRKVKVY